MRTLSRVRTIGTALILTVAAMCALAAAPTTRVLNLGDAAISLEWDPSWQVEEARPDASANSTGFHAPDPSHLLVMLTAHISPGEAGMDTAMRGMVDDKAKELLTQSVQKELPVESFKNGETRGYQVCATDRAPKPEEWKYICQGMAASGNLVVAYTVLYNDPGKAQAKRAVKALQAMQITKST
jgi:hypothetical protein